MWRMVAREEAGTTRCCFWWRWARVRSSARARVRSRLLCGGCGARGARPRCGRPIWRRAAARHCPRSRGSTSQWSPPGGTRWTASTRRPPLGRRSPSCACRPCRPTSSAPAPARTRPSSPSSSPSRASRLGRPPRRSPSTPSPSARRRAGTRWWRAASPRSPGWAWTPSSAWTARSWRASSWLPSGSTRTAARTTAARTPRTSCRPWRRSCAARSRSSSRSTPSRWSSLPPSTTWATRA
mmetsp:Transcript_22452/g.76269  ORF Transcript_22452/g.76269 Transcript_22452/m.76269 type:complete len:239 (+) Transcript_22452:756-1472(+)